MDLGLAIDQGQLADVCRRFGLSRLEVFGSVARGEDRPDSDVDVLYDLLPGRHLTWNVELLSEELAALFGRPVDIVSRRSLHPAIRKNVEAEAALLYAA